MTKQGHTSTGRGRQWRNRAQYRLSIRFIGLLIGAILALSASIIGITIVETYESTKEQTAMLSETMGKADTDSQEAWIDFLQTYTSGESSPYYVRVVLESGEVIYSHQAKNLFSAFSDFKQLLFFNDILWADDFEPYYYSVVTKGGAKVAILVEMEDEFGLIEGIISLTFVTTLLVIVIGSIVTYRFAGTFSRPLIQMNREISELSAEKNGEQLLTVPVSPQEVTNVSQSFNELLQEQRESLEREKQFVTDASHELRTPLAAIRGHVNLIKRRGEKHPEVIPKSIAFIDSESKRMEGLVEQLLKLGRTKGERSEVQLSELIVQVIEELQVMIPQQVEINVDQGVTILGNREGLHQIIRNLIENAVKYTEAHGEIHITLKRQDSKAEFEVADTGIGISDADKQHIFERFYRADQSRSSQVSGTGIGLSIVKALVEEYDGDIQVLDNSPKGSRFIIHFPVK